MIPLRDVIPSRTTPWITYALLAINSAVFVYELMLGPAREQFFMLNGLIPSEFSWTTAITSMFIHGGFLHLAGNMLSLWIFGDNVEDRMGHGRYLVFYLLAGLVAALAQTWALPHSDVPVVGASGAIAGVMGAYLVFYLLAGLVAALAQTWALPHSDVPVVGASGAIAGVMGAYLVLFPQSRILVLIFLFIFIDVVEIPAVLFLGIWFFAQLLSGVGQLAHVPGANIGFWAHIGGFLTGVLGVFVFRQPERQRVEWWGQRM